MSILWNKGIQACGKLDVEFDAFERVLAPEVAELDCKFVHTIQQSKLLVQGEMLFPLKVAFETLEYVRSCYQSPNSKSSCISTHQAKKVCCCCTTNLMYPKGTTEARSHPVRLLRAIS